MKFDVSGNVSLGNGKRKFKKEIEAQTKNQATEKIYLLFGSKNRVRRSRVKIENVEQAK